MSLMNETPSFRGISSATRIPYALETDWPVGAGPATFSIR